MIDYLTVSSLKLNFKARFLMDGQVLRQPNMKHATADK
jgi:hypothetical protein